MNTFKDMQIWQKALNMAVSIYQVNASKGQLTQAIDKAEEFGHMFSASLDNVYKDYMIFNVEELSEEQVKALFLEPEN